MHFSRKERHNRPIEPGNFPHNPLVLGSNPGGPTKIPGHKLVASDLFLFIGRNGQNLGKQFFV